MMKSPIIVLGSELHRSRLSAKHKSGNEEVEREFELNPLVKGYSP